MPLQFHNGKLLFVGGKLAMHSRCCCDQVVCAKICGCCYGNNGLFYDPPAVTHADAPILWAKVPVVTFNSTNYAFPAVSEESVRLVTLLVNWVNGVTGTWQKRWDGTNPAIANGEGHKIVGTLTDTGVTPAVTRTISMALTIAPIATSIWNAETEEWDSGCHWYVRMSFFLSDPIGAGEEFHLATWRDASPIRYASPLLAVDGNCCGGAIGWINDEGWWSEFGWDKVTAADSEVKVTNNKCCVDVEGDCQPKATEQCAGNDPGDGECEEESI